MSTRPLATYAAVHFRWHVANRVGFVELNRPERKNPLTFESYAELRDLFPSLFRGPAETSARAAMCTKSSGR